MLVRIVKMTFKPDKVADFLALFRQSRDKISNFEGCLHLELMQDYSQGNVFVTYSHWTSEDALNNYRHSELFKEVWTNTKILFEEKPIAFSMKKCI